MRRTTARRVATRMLGLTTATLLAFVNLDHLDALATPRGHQEPRPAGSVANGGAPISSSAHRAGAARVSLPVKVPGSLTGLGFDACRAPRQAVMDEMRSTTPYWGVGVYIGGENRSCKRQPSLTRSWVRTQYANGWHVVPIWVGLQAPRVGGSVGRCSDHNFHDGVMSRSNGTARSQGVRAAGRAVASARDLGMAKGSTLFLDMESYRNDVSACNQPVQHFQSGWTARLHALGWKSGYYSSLGTGIFALDYVRTQFPGTYQMPDAVWFSNAGKPTLDGGRYLADKHWRTQRMHQYRLDVDRTYAGDTFALDANAIAIGRGSVPGPARGTCGVHFDFSHYARWQRGDRSAQVSAAQCLLRRHGLYAGDLHGRFDAATARAVGQWQERVGLAVDRELRATTWSSLLSAGSTPLVKRGSANDRVRFLQRALTATSGSSIAISGRFGAGTTDAVSAYQRAVGLPRTGVVDKATWHAIQSGRR